MTESLLPGPLISALRVLTGTQQRFQKTMPGLLLALFLSVSFIFSLSISFHLSSSRSLSLSPLFPCLSPHHTSLSLSLSLFPFVPFSSLSFSHSLFLFPYFLIFDEFQRLEAGGANNKFLKRKISTKKSLQHFWEPIKIYWEMTLSELMYSLWDLCVRF